MAFPNKHRKLPPRCVRGDAQSGSSFLNCCPVSLQSHTILMTHCPLGLDSSGAESFCLGCGNSKMGFFLSYLWDTGEDTEGGAEDSSVPSSKNSAEVLSSESLSPASTSICGMNSGASGLSTLELLPVANVNGMVYIGSEGLNQSTTVIFFLLCFSLEEYSLGDDTSVIARTLMVSLRGSRWLWCQVFRGLILTSEWIWYTGRPGSCLQMMNCWELHWSANLCFSGGPIFLSNTFSSCCMSCNWTFRS